MFVRPRSAEPFASLMRRIRATRMVITLRHRSGDDPPIVRPRRLTLLDGPHAHGSKSLNARRSIVLIPAERRDARSTSPFRRRSPSQLERAAAGWQPTPPTGRSIATPNGRSRAGGIGAGWTDARHVGAPGQVVGHLRYGRACKTGVDRRPSDTGSARRRRAACADAAPTGGCRGADQALAARLIRPGQFG